MHTDEYCVLMCLNLLGLVTINLAHICQQIEDTAGVTPLVVVPADELAEIVVKRNASLGIEDRRIVVAVHVGRNDVIFGVLNNAYSNISHSVLAIH